MFKNRIVLVITSSIVTLCLLAFAAMGAAPTIFQAGIRTDSIQGLSTMSPPGMVPLGGMIAVMPNVDTVNSWQPPASGVIKDGFMRADGAVVPSGQGSPLQGKTLPNMTPSVGNDRYMKASRATSWTTGVYATGGANTVTLAPTNIPQLSTNYTPAGTNAASSVSISVDKTQWNSNQNTHSHTVNVYGGGATYHQAAGVGSSISTADNANDSAGTGTASSSSVSWTAGSVASGTGTATAQAFAGTPATITVGTGSPTAINNEAAYIEVVWLIRVK
jgi:hypothetical protein